MVGGKTAANVSGKVLRYLARRPFLSREDQSSEKAKLEADYAREIFKGLVLLKGTALKIAQMLSFELDFVPAAIRAELEKSCNKVPPLNRALVRKVISNAFEQSPEGTFRQFDYNAFAAASLGQVHYGEAPDGRRLAVKVQYPGIDKTIENDIQLVRGLITPTPYARFALPVLEEIRQRLYEEIDYLQEAQNTIYFHDNLILKDIVVPEVYQDFSTHFILTTEFLEGLSLDTWLGTAPDRESRNHVAQLLYDQFMFGFYRLGCVHADPNPGNFIIMEGLKVGIADFGCIKRFSPGFVELYEEIPGIMANGTEESYFEHLEKMNILKKKIDQSTRTDIYKIFRQMGSWFSRLYSDGSFDFGKNKGFIAEGKTILQQLFRYKKYFQPNPEFVYLDRTLYGLFRLFEKMNAQIRTDKLYAHQSQLQTKEEI